MKWRLGVVGYPIEHSLTPQLHEKALSLCGLRGTSERVAMPDADRNELHALMGERFDALSVTMPLKEAAATICDARDAVSTRTGVVNSLLWRDGHVQGACTDGRGFLDALLAQFHVTPTRMNVLVHGAGGAARGIVDAFVHAHVGTVVIHGRTPANVERMTNAYDHVFDADHEVDHFDLVVNTQPAHAPAPFGPEVAGVDAETIAVDITYEPRMSTWRQSYEDLGCRSANGLGLLAYQAALQMRWWWDLDVDGAKLLEVIA